MFGDNWNVLLPSYLTEENKGRLQDALTQFHPKNRKEIVYDDFFKDFDYNYFLQGDIVLDIRVATWDADTASYNKSYLDALIISNTCDISNDNKRKINPKQCLFAPLIKLEDYVSDLREEKYPEAKLEEFVTTLKSQGYSNLIYLPKVHEEDYERLALLDRLFWFPIEELTQLLDTINDERISSLNHYGFYLLIFKLSYHLCRVPEQCDREVA